MKIVTKIKAFFRNKTALKKHQDKRIEDEFDNKINGDINEYKVISYKYENSIYNRNPVLRKFAERYGDIEKIERDRNNDRKEIEKYEEKSVYTNDFKK